MLACYIANNMKRARQHEVNTAETVPFQLRIRKDLVIAWKIQATKEGRTASQIAEQLITEYLKKKGGK